MYSNLEILVASMKCLDSNLETLAEECNVQMIPKIGVS